jgi:hypothetical protein
MTRNDPGEGRRDHLGEDGVFRDDDLRARFAVLRREEEALAPEFALPRPRVAQGQRRSVGKRIAFAASLVTAISVVVLVIALWFAQRFAPRFDARKAHPGPGNPVASLAEWRAPTDFLLETPGRELLRTVPAIGVWHDYTQATKPNPKHPLVRNHVLP